LRKPALPTLALKISVGWAFPVAQLIETSYIDGQIA
jgi:hypothetical protein